MENGKVGAEITTPPYTYSKNLGAWLARANNTVYQAATDGFVICKELTDVNEISGLTDSGNPPTAERCRECAWSGSAACFCMPVKKNDYWKTVSVGTPTVYWIPLEP